MKYIKLIKIASQFDFDKDGWWEDTSNSRYWHVASISHGRTDDGNIKFIQFIIWKWRLAIYFNKKV